MGGTTTEEDLDPELLLEACLVDEIRLQCDWGEYHFAQLRQQVKSCRSHQRTKDFRDFIRDRSLAFAEVQAILTCAAAVDSIITGRGPPPPKGMTPVSDHTRAELKRRLELEQDFEIPGRARRNDLLHIAERILPWSKPGELRGDFLTGIHPKMPKEMLQPVLRALDFDTLEFAVRGEKCQLTLVEAALQRLRRATSKAAPQILRELDPNSMWSSGAGPI